jgi:hypothetical protein
LKSSREKGRNRDSAAKMDALRPGSKDNHRRARDFPAAHGVVIACLVDKVAGLRQIQAFPSNGGPPQLMKKLLALALALFAWMAVPAMAQQVEFDIYDKSDFDKQLASNQPVIVHVNTTW